MPETMLEVRNQRYYNSFPAVDDISFAVHKHEIRFSWPPTAPARPLPSGSSWAFCPQVPARCSSSGTASPVPWTSSASATCLRSAASTMTPGCWIPWFYLAAQGRVGPGQGEGFALAGDPDLGAYAHHKLESCPGYAAKGPVYCHRPAPAGAGGAGRTPFRPRPHKPGPV